MPANKQTNKINDEDRSCPIFFTKCSAEQLAEVACGWLTFKKIKQKENKKIQKIKLSTKWDKSFVSLIPDFKQVL